MKFLIPIMLPALLVVTIASTKRAVNEVRSGKGHCLEAESDQSKMVFGKIRRTLTDDRGAPVRKAMGLTQIPPDSVVLIVEPMLCAKAAVAIATHRRLSPDELKLVLVRFRSQYWAEASGLTGGEWPLVFLLDSTLSRVTAQH